MLIHYASNNFTAVCITQSILDKYCVDVKLCVDDIFVFLDDLCIICSAKYAVNPAIKKKGFSTTIMVVKHQYQGISYP